MIPPVAHFIWLTRDFPWVNLLSLSSAARHGGFEKVVLHHTAELDLASVGQELSRIRGLELRPIDVVEAARALPGDLGQKRQSLSRLYEKLEQPAARSNLLRVLLLAREGGVYLDMDTVTVASLGPLRERAGVFCGAERVAFPGEAVRRKWSRAYAAGLCLSGLRGVLSRVPRGYRAFRRFERLYPLAPNNAVLASEAGHPLVLDLLRRMLELPEEQALRRYALGTHLLQDAVRDYRGSDLEVHAPSAFYPLGPEISRHWFRATRGAALSEVLAPETCVVHWYASLRTARQQRELDPERVRELASRQLFSALALKYGTGGVA